MRPQLPLKERGAHVTRAGCTEIQFHSACHPPFHSRAARVTTRTSVSRLCTVLRLPEVLVGGET